ncbi:excisionase [Meridianimarinicoccus roseus]|uniref:Excisionase n=1 Tax=Meridianimarinicoccus roseus TaxID=2072018 RepID=A0A2V2LD65_9RHOB|nr:helix-turn-helix transcriptional regulator [Meridianimarinicoccus roseus]PWR01236.1 excisionase [Meridianimarinicoccus roseus]
MANTAFSDHEFLTVRELAELLRLKERKIYDLAASGEVPCSRATGKLLFPAREIRAWIESAKSGGTVANPARPPIFLGSHDPLLDWAIRDSRCGLATYFDGSLDGLERFTRGEGVACGLHVHDPASGTWNVTAVSRAAAGQNAVLVTFSRRMRGLVFRPDGPAPASLADVAGLRLAPRQAESGTSGLFRDLAAQAGLDLADVPLAPVARTEDDAVESVRRGTADVAFGLEAVARAYGLDFLPLMDEEFALLVDRKAWFDPALQTLLGFLRGENFAARAAALGGYALNAPGTVLWNG